MRRFFGKNTPPDILTDPLERLMNLPVRIPKNSKPQGGQILIPRRIHLSMLRLKVLGTIQFND